MGSRTTLYKYLDVDGGIKMLQGSNLQFTNATCLNDPFDCHQALFDYSNVPAIEHNWPPAGFLQEKGLTDMENLRNRAWICSLSKVHDSLLMWAYYGNHKGVCIGLDMEKASIYLSRIHCKFFIGAMELEVQYKDVIERPDFFHNTEDLFRYQLSTKAKAWEHEKEVRLVLLDPSPYTMQLRDGQKAHEGPVDWKELRAYPPLGGECFESLYLGIKIDKMQKEGMIKEARRINQSINIYQMEIDPEAFRLKERLI